MLHESSIKFEIFMMRLWAFRLRRQFIGANKGFFADCMLSSLLTLRPSFHNERCHESLAGIVKIKKAAYINMLEALWSAGGSRSG